MLSVPFPPVREKNAYKYLKEKYAYNNLPSSNLSKLQHVLSEHKITPPKQVLTANPSMLTGCKQ